MHWAVAVLSAVSLGKCNFSLNTGLSEDQAVTNHEGVFFQASLFYRIFYTAFSGSFMPQTLETLLG